MTTINETLAREILDRLISLETLLKSHIEETARGFDETNQRIDETNQRITDANNATNQRIDRVEDRVERLDTRMTDWVDKLFYTLIGVGTAVAAAVIAGQILD